MFFFWACCVYIHELVFDVQISGYTRVRCNMFASNTLPGWVYHDTHGCVVTFSIPNGRYRHCYTTLITNICSSSIPKIHCTIPSYCVTITVQERRDNMKEFKSTDEALNEFYNNLYMVTGDTTGEHLFAIGFKRCCSICICCK